MLTIHMLLDPVIPTVVTIPKDIKSKRMSKVVSPPLRKTMYYVQTA